MRLFCALIGTLVLVGGPSVAQPLSYDPYYVLPAGPGQTSIDLGLSTVDASEVFNASDVMAMAKFNPYEKIEVGARFAFGWINDSASNFSSLVVGAKYSLGANRAATANLAVPAGNVDDPGLSIGIMNTTALAAGFDLNAQLQLGLLKGYTGGTGMVVDALIEPSKVFNDHFVGYLDVLITSNTNSFSDFLAVNLGPNLDIGLSDGTVLNLGVTLGLTGDAKQAKTGLTAILLRAM